MKNKGITLVALVITIIIMIILAGVSINVLLDENGLINKARNGASKYQDEAIKEKINLAVLTSSSNIEVKIDESILKEQLDEHLGEGKYTYTINEETGEVTVTYNDKEYKIAANGASQDNVENYKYILSDNNLADEYTLIGFQSNNYSGLALNDNGYYSNYEQLHTLFAAYSTGYAGVYIEQPINFSNIDSIEFEFYLASNMEGLTNTGTVGLQDQPTKDTNFEIKESVKDTTYEATYYKIALDTRLVTGNKYIKVLTEHGSESSVMTTWLALKSIKINYAN